MFGGDQIGAQGVDTALALRPNPPRCADRVWSIDGDIDSISGKSCTSRSDRQRSSGSPKIDIQLPPSAIFMRGPAPRAMLWCPSVSLIPNRMIGRSPESHQPQSIDLRPHTASDLARAFAASVESSRRISMPRGRLKIDSSAAMGCTLQCERKLHLAWSRTWSRARLVSAEGR